jgi:hypothetical protein
MLWCNSMCETRKATDKKKTSGVYETPGGLLDPAHRLFYLQRIVK